MKIVYTVLIFFGILIFTIGFLLFGFIHRQPLQKDLISYKSGYNFVLTETYSLKVPILESARHNHVNLENGVLTIEKGFAWNGATMCPDRHRHRASLVHDALCHLLAHEKLSKNYKDLADDIYVKLTIEDGDIYLNALFSKFVMNLGGHHFLKPEEEFQAP